MTKATKIFIGILVIVIIIVGGQWILENIFSTKPVSVCGPSGKGYWIDISNCSTSCQTDEDCKFTCGCGAISTNEICHEEGTTYDCIERNVSCENNICVTGEEKKPQCEVGIQYQPEECKCPEGTLSHPIFDEEKQEWFQICKPVSMEVLDETADWKTYRNEGYKYEVKYPQDWELREHPIDPQHKDFTKTYDEYFCIFTVYSTEDKDFYETGLQSIKAQGYYQEEVSLDNIPSIKFFHPKFPGHAYYAFPKEKNGKEVYFHISYGAFEITEVTTITIKEHECDHTFNQMLSTFQFLE